MRELDDLLKLLKKERKKTSPEKEELVSLLSKIGTAYYNLDDYQKALEHFSEALRITKNSHTII